MQRSLFANARNAATVGMTFSFRSLSHCVGALLACALIPSNLEADETPNFVIIFLDDSGWGDFHPFGNPAYKTPNVVKLAAEGCRYDNFYVPQAICSASRAALMTGTFPSRNQVFGAHKPGGLGLDPKFTTLAELLQANGYATGMFGKWHLGDVDGQRPLDRGFDEHHGIYYSNDMWKHHAVDPEFWGQWPLNYYVNKEIKAEDVGLEEQDQFTTWITEGAVDFINRNADEPFFCYVPHPQPHVPLHVSDKFRGKSGTGLYGDVMMELDWSVGEIMKTLEENGIAGKTVVMLTSDNGPWAGYGDHAGVTPFREAKATSFDGGCRSACIIRYPGEIEAGSRSTRTWCSVDVFPTFAALAGVGVVAADLDGHNVWSIIAKGSDEPHPAAFIEQTIGSQFQGIITTDGKWKLHVPHGYRTMKGSTPGKDGLQGKYRQAKIGYALFDMVKDPEESTNVIKENPEVAKRLIETAEKHRQEWFPDQNAFQWK